MNSKLRNKILAFNKACREVEAIIKQFNQKSKLHLELCTYEGRIVLFECKCPFNRPSVTFKSHHESIHGLLIYLKSNVHFK